VVTLAFLQVNRVKKSGRKPMLGFRPDKISKTTHPLPDRDGHPRRGARIGVSNLMRE